MRKNILIDYSQIPVKRQGAGVYAYNLLKHLYSLDKINRYFILLQDDDEALDILNNENIKLVKVNHKFFRIFAFRFLLEQFYIPYLILKNRIDIIHSLHYSFPIISFKARKVVTIHDLTFFIYPELHVPFKRLYFRLFIKLSTILCDKIICVSESTKRDLVFRYSRSSNNIEVIPLGKDNRFSINLDKKEVEKVKRKYNISKKYILFIGTLEPRKNINKLILAFNLLCKSDKRYQLVIVGKKGWFFRSIFDLVTKNNLSDSITFTGFIDEEEKPFIIAGATIFIYPSFYEGFGIPVLEAMSCGIPTITSNVSSLPEVAGEAALLIDPMDEKNIFNAMLKLLNDSALCEDLALRSLDQSSKFSWENTTLKTINLYGTLK